MTTTENKTVMLNIVAIVTALETIVTKVLPTWKAAEAYVTILKDVYCPEVEVSVDGQHAITRACGGAYSQHLSVETIAASGHRAVTIQLHNNTSWIVLAGVFADNVFSLTRIICDGDQGIDTWGSTSKVACVPSDIKAYGVHGKSGSRAIKRAAMVAAELRKIKALGIGPITTYENTAMRNPIVITKSGEYLLLR